MNDDQWIIVHRPSLRQPPSLTWALTEPYWPRGFGGVMWRPTVLASFALDYQVAGGEPNASAARWFHAVNVLWAALAAALLTLLACRLSDPATGLVAGLLFAVHPVHVEAVANVVGRAELMAAAGYAAALLCALRAAERRAYLAGVVLAAGFAIASKEHAATLPAAVVLLYLVRSHSPRAALWPAAAAAAPVVTYFLVRGNFAHGVFAGGLAPGLEGLGALERGWAMVGISVQWWRLLLFPLHLSADYSPNDVVASTQFTPAHVLGLLVWAAAGWAAWRWRRTAPGRALVLGLAWVIITVSPVANVVVPTELLVAERTLYLTSWGVTFALAVGAFAIPVPARVRAALLAAVLLAAGARSVARTRVWRDDETLYQASLRDAPRSYRTLWNLGKDEFQAGRLASGERLLQGAIAAAPQVAGPRLDLGRAYASAGLWKPAAVQLREATVVSPGLAPAWALLAPVLLSSGDTAAAAAAAEEALRRFPNDAEVVRNANAVLAARRR